MSKIVTKLTIQDESLCSGENFNFNIRPINTRKGENMTWGVMELRKWLRERMMGNMRKGITIEEIAGECETDFSCRMVTASRSENGLVLRVEDGTCSQVVRLEYRG